MKEPALPPAVIMEFTRPNEEEKACLPIRTDRFLTQGSRCEEAAIGISAGCIYRDSRGRSREGFAQAPSPPQASTAAQRLLTTRSSGPRLAAGLRGGIPQGSRAQGFRPRGRVSDTHEPPPRRRSWPSSWA